MMYGVVNQSGEATIPVILSNQNKQTQLIEAVIDTGYTGFLTLPHSVMVNLNFPWTGVDRVTLGDGSEVTFKVYAATVIWDGEYCKVPVNESETEPLVGMSLLYGYELKIRAIAGGQVTIRKLK
ncbi:MAG: clan AA aspartic protease [Phormidium sp. GEM2.Bin31]|nr:MAG: clan AA aspartic protease [Phormidium sp. GEM2.Bin31]